MKINEIQLGLTNISLEAKVIDVSETREVTTKYGRRSVADIMLEDDTGQITLTLWEEKINSVSVGDNIKINGAFVTSFRDKIQLNIPKTGKIEVMKK